ncbi:hypothetical protein PHSY_004400 [Pseudozyma hubeiensis SY62]|uniref:Hemerythrin-like domain-containing protein n=1 Tax=Pseudozyma hubeiensis (strain SY62) TaxID=1305764 RepID=R9P659_PSEHS|nr:hypothetical protein PHSY_004400 [Pseudozyma hubeiensis SY62]GAC96816.1 hypothetical protein PHSY_004400 [Pseudozyma hubeiensis SY62]
MTGKKNLLDEIKVDHDNIRDLHKRFHDAYKAGDHGHCEAIVNTIIHEAAVHSDAEELSIYKLMERFNMASAAEKDRDDHQQVKQAVSELDTHQISGAGLDVFAQKVDKACRLFIEHAEEEENDQLPRLCKELSADEQSKAVDDFLSASKMAPTRPHPSAPQSGGMTQKLAGGMSKPLDKAVEMGRKFVDHDCFNRAFLPANWIVFLSSVLLFDWEARIIFTQKLELVRLLRRVPPSDRGQAASRPTAAIKNTNPLTKTKERLYQRQKTSSTVRVQHDPNPDPAQID